MIEKYNGKVITDIKNIPGYVYKAGFIGVESVSTGKVFLKKNNFGTYPYCSRHGFILLITKQEKGNIWRCRELGCDEGCYELTHKL